MATRSAASPPTEHDDRGSPPAPPAPQSDELELPTRAAEVVERLGHVSDLVKFCLHEVSVLARTGSVAASGLAVALHSTCTFLRLAALPWPPLCRLQKGETAIERLEVQIVLILTVELAISAVELYHGHGGAFARSLWELLAGEASTLVDMAGQRH